VVPIILANAAWDRPVVWRKDSSFMPKQYQFGIIWQAHHTNLDLAGRTHPCYQFGMNRLKALRERKGISAPELAELVGTSQPQIWRLEAWPDSPNGRRMTVEWAKRIAPHLDCKPEDLLGLAENDELISTAFDDDNWPPVPADEIAPTIGTETGVRGIPEGTVPQIDVTAGMGGGGLTIVNPGVPGRSGMTFAAEHVRDYWRLPNEVISALGLKSTDIAILPVQGDSMADTLIEGDFVFVDTRHRIPSPDGIYALADSFGGVVVKRLELLPAKSLEDIRVRIISDNPKHSPREFALDEVSIIGRVVRRFGVV
jgi:DNA-binding Xre family transcriptional regulator